MDRGAAMLLRLSMLLSMMLTCASALLVTNPPPLRTLRFAAKPRPKPASASIAVERLAALKAAGGLPGVTAAEQFIKLQRSAAPAMRSPPAQMSAASTNDAESEENDENTPADMVAADEAGSSAPALDGLPSWLPLRRDTGAAPEEVAPPSSALTDGEEPKFFQVMDKAANIGTALFALYLLWTFAGLNPAVQ